MKVKNVILFSKIVSFQNVNAAFSKKDASKHYHQYVIPHVEYLHRDLSENKSLQTKVDNLETQLKKVEAENKSLLTKVDNLETQFKIERSLSQKTSVIVKCQLRLNQEFFSSPFQLSGYTLLLYLVCEISTLKLYICPQSYDLDVNVDKAWPLKKIFKITLLNPFEDRNHCTETIDFGNPLAIKYSQKPCQLPSTQGYGLIALGEYLKFVKDDIIHVKISSTDNDNTPWLI